MLGNYEFWFVVGSQFLYGPEVLETVAARAQEMSDKLNASGNLPCKLVYKVTAKTNQEISDVVREANHDPKCAGIITWCHTFSPSKMGINGFVNLQKPYCHFATQYNRSIPNDEIDMAAIEQPVPIEGKSVAMGDTLKIDTLQKAVQPEPIIIK